LRIGLPPSEQQATLHVARAPRRRGDEAERTLVAERRRRSSVRRAREPARDSQRRSTRDAARRTPSWARDFLYFSLAETLMHNLSMAQALLIWSELMDAYHGKNGFGGDTAEIYMYRLMPYDPALVHDPTADHNGTVDQANRSLCSLLLFFEQARG